VQHIMTYDLEVTYLLKTSQLLFNSKSHFGNSLKNALTHVLGASSSTQAKASRLSFFICSSSSPTEGHC
jgi:hypothetical protein